VQLTQKIEIT